MRSSVTYLRTKNINRSFFIKLAFLSCCFVLMSANVMTQSFCAIPKDHEMGYISSIESVVLNSDSTHTIKLRVQHSGNSEPGWKALNHYSVEADVGTYSDISYETVYGDVSHNGINMGPNLGGWNKDGFRIASISGIGPGMPAIFLITYTLTGGLQDQWTMAKAKGNTLEVFFPVEDFEAVLECNVTLAPYYAMPDGGKIEDSTNKIGPELTALSEYLGIPFSNEIYQIVYDNPDYLVIVDLFPVDGKYELLLSDTASYGLTFVVPDPDEQVITGQIPIQQLTNLNTLDNLAYARPSYPAKTNMGLVTSQGDTSMLSHITRKIFTAQPPGSLTNGDPITGSGIKIGVLSDSYNTKPNNPANDDILKGDLPGVGFNGDSVPNPNNTIPVDLVLDYPYGQASDEGRAMLQIIHDVAPGAELAFRTGVLGAVDMTVGIGSLEAAGCDFIVDDISYVTEPFFHDGIVSDAVNAAVGSGVSYFTSAGNFGDKSYQSMFSGTASVIEGITGPMHNFATNGVDNFQQVSATEPGNYMIVLQWDDGSDFTSTTTDLDIFLSDENGYGLIGYNKVNTGGNPIEILPFIVSDTTESNILIVNSSSEIIPVEFKYIVFRGQLSIDEYHTGSSTVVGHANSDGAIAVGAVRYDYAPAYLDSLVVMSYSSVGGMLIDTDDREKPDFTAPNGVNTGVEFGSPNIENDSFPNFFGTSAAAPHAAAVAALLQEAKYRYYGEGQELSPSEIRNSLKNTAIDMYVSGYDVSSGSGFIQADEALLTLGNSAPVLSSITYGPAGSIPGLDTVEVSVIGDYYAEGAVLYFNDSLLATTVVDANTLTATIPPFTDLYPPIQAWNPSKEGTNGYDGGFSNSLYFTEKPTIVGTIAHKYKTYGENLPEITVSYLVKFIDGTEKPIDSVLNSEEQSRVENIPITTNATALANAGLWPIEASLEDPLNPVSTVPATDPLDIDLLYNYNFSFKNGLLSISKLNLLIKPNDTSYVYNDSIGGFTYSFIFDDSLIVDSNATTIRDSLEVAYLRDLLGNATVLVNGRATALVNEGEIDLDSTSFMVSTETLNRLATALVNGDDTALVNGQATALVNAASLGMATALVNRTATALVNGRATALVNAEPLVNGRATALVNGKATALVNGRATVLVNGKATALVNGKATALVNGSQATALVNLGSFNDDNNRQAIIIMDTTEVESLLDTVAKIPPDQLELTSISLITGNTAGDHWIAPGSFIASNFKVTYGLGILTINPDTAAVDLVISQFSYNGTRRSCPVLVDPPELNVIITYNNSELPPKDVGDYIVIATVVDSNYVGADTGIMTIVPADLTVSADNQTMIYGTTPEPDLTYDTIGTIYSGDGLTGYLLRYGDQNVGNYEIHQGTLTAGDNYDIEFFPGTFSIIQAEATLVLEDLTQVYDGLGKTVTAVTQPAGLHVDFVYSGDSINAGTCQVTGVVNTLNYYSDPVTETLTITPATATVSLVIPPNNTYDNTPKPVTATTDPSGLQKIITYDESETPPTNADSYTVIATVNNSNYVGADTGIMTIAPAGLTITADDQSKYYGDDDPPLTFDPTITQFNDPISGSLTRATGLIVGDYPITQDVVFSAGSNYTISFEPGTLTINRLNVDVSAIHQVINEGDEEPPFTFTYDTFAYNETVTDVFGSDGPDYSTGYIDDAGVYPVIFPDSSANYIFTLPNTINLYVNPDKNGTKSVKPRLVCVEELPLPNESGFPYIAYFEYGNKNNDHVFIFIGEKNELTIEGNGEWEEANPQPELFLAGGSQVDWGVYFDGNKITWTVTSQHHGHPSSTGSNASSTSNKCHNSSGAVTGGDPLPEGSGIWAYPNPITDKVTIGVTNEPVSDEVVILTMQGGMQTVKTKWMAKSNSTEIDFSKMSPGMYIIRVETTQSVEFVRVVKN